MLTPSSKLPVTVLSGFLGAGTKAVGMGAVQEEQRR
jgi:G3E family GTPase